MPPRKKKNDFYSSDQDVVMRDYESTSALTKKKIGKEALHMFFSPTHVPVGLTDEQIAICVLLYPVRKAQTSAYHDIIKNRAIKNGAEYIIAESIAATRSLKLPDEFMPGRTMTDVRFKRGIYKFLVQASTLI